MNIGIIGAGNVGTGIARHLLAHGHHVMLSFSRDPEKLASAARQLGPHASTGSVEQACAFGPLVILATPWAVTLETVGKAAHALAGKIVWDTTNPMNADMSALLVGTTSSGGEAVAALLPGTRVVKAIPPFAQVLHGEPLLVAGLRPNVFVCADDAPTRQIVAGLVEQIGATAVEAGALEMARFTEPLGLLLVQLAYRQGMGGRIGSALIK